MKDIYSLFIVSIIGLIIFAGIGTIADFTYEKGLLSDESVMLYLSYNAQWVPLSNEAQLMYDSIYVDGINQGEVDPDVNLLEAFIKEYGEAKARIGVLRNTLRLVTILPSMVFLSLPFIDYEDVRYYVSLFFLILIVTISVAIFKALFQRRID